MGLRTEENQTRKHSEESVYVWLCVCVWGGGWYLPSTLDVFDKYYCTILL